jgi:hypothetical protein
MTNCTSMNYILTTNDRVAKVKGQALSRALNLCILVTQVTKVDYNRISSTRVPFSERGAGVDKQGKPLRLPKVRTIVAKTYANYY